MSYPVLTLAGESTAEASVKLQFELATCRAQAKEFLRVDFLAQGAQQSRQRTAVIRVLNQQKKQGRVRFFLLAEDFSTECQASEFIENKYPYLMEDADLCSGVNAYVLIKL